MKYLKNYKLFESVNETEINDVCKRYNIKNYTINEDGSIDVDGSVYIDDEKLTKLPINFRNVNGSFLCYGNKLTNLKGAPRRVTGDFSCSYNKLTSLKGAPEYVGGSFFCNDNKLVNLIDVPDTIKNYLRCHRNKITSLDGLLWKSFDNIDLKFNPIYEIVSLWINRDDHDDLIEYFLDLNVIQEGEEKPKLILPRLELFYEDSGLEMKRVVSNISFKEIEKNYEIIKG